MNELKCRFCNTSLQHSFADLGVSPVANRFLREGDLYLMEPFFPLHAHVCHTCFLVQLPVVISPEELFTDYKYFSSYSTSWLNHARDYAEMMVARFGFDAGSLVVEVASNDGYLLQYFKRKGIPVLGIEPATNVAEVAEAGGIPTLESFFGADTAQDIVISRQRADLIVGNNVLAHVPDINDFVKGLAILLKDEGIIALEFPHLLNLMEQNQFDTIYHEHYSYLSLIAVDRILAAHGLVLFDVEEIPTHGGSLRLFVAHRSDETRSTSDRVNRLKEKENRAGLESTQTYSSFAEKIKETKRKLLELLIAIKDRGNSIAGYGAPAKGNTLLNYCGIGTDFIDYTVDRSPHKQGLFLPGSRIPIFTPDKIRETRPDYVLILPWNLKDEIAEQMCDIRSWGGKFIIPIPEPHLL